jgi:1,4-dihydroxy-2-naphthoate octaprenyltransferase
MDATVTGRDSAQGWVKVFRDPPFYLVGVLPFGLGTLLAVASGRPLLWGVWALGSVAVALIMAMTFLVNEYFDFDTDAANVGYNKFSGGSRSLPNGLVNRRHVLVAAGVCTALALAIGLVIQFVYKTGPVTLPFGIAAALIGYAYTGKPFRLIYRGVGEILIGVSVGWMPIFIGYYLLAGMPAGSYIHILSLPVAASIVMVILANEYPDYESDAASGKRNLVVRFGRERAVWLYAGCGAVYLASLIYVALTYMSSWRQYVLAVPLLLCLDVSTVMILGAWRTAKKLEKLCLATILLNLSTVVLFLVVVWP